MQLDGLEGDEFPTNDDAATTAKGKLSIGPRPEVGSLALDKLRHCGLLIRQESRNQLRLSNVTDSPGALFSQIYE